MSQQINRYKADVRDISFLLFEQFNLQGMLGNGPFANWGKEEVLAVMDEVYSWAQKTPRPDQLHRRRRRLQA